MSFPRRHPGASILDLADQGAWEGERKKAARLEDLESSSGRPYQRDEETGRTVGFGINAEPFYAHTDFEVIPGHRYHEEVAYLCPLEELWIQGVPSGEEYDDIGFLSGSAGLKLFCRSCGEEIGRLVEKMS